MASLRPSNGLERFQGWFILFGKNAPETASQGLRTEDTRRLTMARTTFSLPEDLLEEMRKHSEVNWSSVCREAIERRLGIERQETAPRWFMAWLENGLERLETKEK